MADNWFYSRDGAQREGPVSEQALRQLLSSMQLQPNDLVWRPGMPQWMPAANVPELSGAGAGAVGAPQPAPVVASPYLSQQPLQTLPYSGSTGSGELMCTSRTLDLLRQTRPWVRFISILILIGAAFMVLGGGAVLLRALAMSSGAGVRVGRAAPSYAMGMACGYVIFAILYIMPAVYLSRYASRITELLQTRREDKLEQAIEAQKSFWKFIGIMTMVVIAFYLVVIIVVMLIAISR